MLVSVQAQDFDVSNEMAALRAGRTDIGAIVSFTGLVRDMAGDATISSLTLEHYPGMTEAALEAIGDEAQARWPLQGLRIVHRYGTLAPGDQIVLVIAASSHRQAAFDAANFVMDYLKTRAPFWKKEGVPGGGQWVDARDDDTAAEARWTDPV